MSILGQLTNAPRIDDHRECQVWYATARVIQHCFHGILNCQERGWTLIPFWLRSVDRNKENTTVKTVTLGGFNLKPIFDERKLKILVFASFSPHRYNLPIVKGSFCRYGSGLVALQSTCRCRRFTVGFAAGNVR